MLSDGSKRCSCGGGCHTFGACLRAKNIRAVVGQAHGEITAWDSNLDRYEYAVRQGIQPEGTTPTQVEAAITASRMTDTPFRADA